MKPAQSAPNPESTGRASAHDDVDAPRPPDSPYLGDTVMAAGLAQMYAVKMQYWDGLKKGFRQGFQCFAEQPEYQFILASLHYTIHNAIRKGCS